MSATTPLVSICLPNLNTLPFLGERIESIFGQSYENWELIVSDNYSDDGAWEFLLGVAQRDPRVSVAQAPREGMYPNWNSCLARSRGEYVYIATSDDTMALDCLEKMVAVLERHRECDLAHCPAVIMDEEGRTAHDLGRASRTGELQVFEWPDHTMFAHGLETLTYRPHVRRAPYAGLLHLIGEQVILSITQLLIRRSLFSRIGNFGSRWGSLGDFNWEMKAGLVADMVHVPDTWASWRMHAAQATASADLFGPDRVRKTDEMITDAVEACEPLLDRKITDGLKSHWLGLGSDMRWYYAGLYQRHRATERRVYQFTQFVSGSTAVRSEMLGRMLGRSRWPDVAPTHIRTWLESTTSRPVIETLAHAGRDSGGVSEELAPVIDRAV